MRLILSAPLLLAKDTWSLRKSLAPRVMPDATRFIPPTAVSPQIPLWRVPAGMQKLGSKTAARNLARKTTAPPRPGTRDPIAKMEDVREAAREIGFPVV